MKAIRLQLVLAAVSALAAVAAFGQVPTEGMVRIPDGVFRPLFAASNELKTVPVKSFQLDVAPVSTGEFLQFVRANPRWRRSEVKRLFADESYLKNWSADLEPGTNAALESPVTQVSWFAAKAYATWKGKRLPTVAEWECAASAGFTNADGNKDELFKKQVLQWYCTPSPERLQAAGSGRPNFWGVRDMHGLIWEWTLDFNTAMVNGDARSDSGPDRQFFCGAGSVGAQDVQDFPAFMRYAFRSSLKADYCVHNLGFRCAKDL